MSALIRNDAVIEYIQGMLTNLRFLSALPSEYAACVESYGPKCPEGQYPSNKSKK